MPMIGFYMILVLCVGYLFSIKKIPLAWSRLASVLLVVYCLILIGMTIQQNYNWRDRIAYFEHNLKFTNSTRLHINLGNAYMSKGDTAKALAHLQEAVKLSDAYPQTRYNIGNIYHQKGDLVKAEQEYLKSLALDPNFLYSYPMLIQLYEKKKEYEKELPYLRRLLKIYPGDLKIQVMYANALWNSGKIDEADRAFAAAVELSHNDPKIKKAIEKTRKQK
jgi:tetratricopeptide (TPR) repeat protein